MHEIMFVEGMSRFVSICLCCTITLQGENRVLEIAGLQSSSVQRTVNINL